MEQKEFMDYVSKKLEEKIISFVGLDRGLIDRLCEDHQPEPYNDIESVNSSYGSYGVFGCSSDILKNIGFDDCCILWSVYGDLEGEHETPSEGLIEDVWLSNGKLPIPTVKKYGEVVLEEPDLSGHLSFETDDFKTVTGVESTKAFPDLNNIQLGQSIEDAIEIILDYFVQHHYISPQH